MIAWVCVWYTQWISNYYYKCHATCWLIVQEWNDLLCKTCCWYRDLIYWKDFLRIKNFHYLNLLQSYYPVYVTMMFSIISYSNLVLKHLAFIYNCNEKIKRLVRKCLWCCYNFGEFLIDFRIQRKRYTILQLFSVY